MRQFKKKEPIVDDGVVLSAARSIFRPLQTALAVGQFAGGSKIAGCSKQVAEDALALVLGHNVECASGGVVVAVCANRCL